jgi:polar amino acid transport system permease protein
MSAAGEATDRAWPQGAVPEVRKQRPQPGQWVAGAVILIVAGLCIRILITNPNFQWRVVWHYLLVTQITDGWLITLALTASSMLIGVVLGTLLAVMRLSANPIVSLAARGYIWFFRGTPVLVQLIFWYNLAALFPAISLSVGGLTFFHLSTNALIGEFTAALLGLGLNEGAYMAEIVRAGIISVGEGQVEAARALGMRRLPMMRLIVLPQAMRVIVPPTGNETIGMLKTTSLVSVISLADLLYSAQQIYSVNYETIPLLIVASLWYLLFTTVLSTLQARIERRTGRGMTRTGTPSPGGPESAANRLLRLVTR